MLGIYQLFVFVNFVLLLVALFQLINLKLQEPTNFCGQLLLSLFRLQAVFCFLYGNGVGHELEMVTSRKQTICSFISVSIHVLQFLSQAEIFQPDFDQICMFSRIKSMMFLCFKFSPHFYRYIIGLIGLAAFCTLILFYPDFLKLFVCRTVCSVSQFDVPESFSS